MARRFTSNLLVRNARGIGQVDDKALSRRRGPLASAENLQRAPCHARGSRRYRDRPGTLGRTRRPERMKATFSRSQPMWQFISSVKGLFLGLVASAVCLTAVHVA